VLIHAFKERIREVIFKIKDKKAKMRRIAPPTGKQVS